MGIPSHTARHRTDGMAPDGTRGGAPEPVLWRWTADWSDCSTWDKLCEEDDAEMPSAKNAWNGPSSSSTARPTGVDCYLHRPGHQCPEARRGFFLRMNAKGTK